MKKLLWGFVSLLSFSSEAWSANPVLQKIRWQAQSWRPLNLVLKVSSKAPPSAVTMDAQTISDKDITIDVGLLAHKDSKLKLKNGMLARVAQSVEGAAVKGTWIQTIYSSSGQVTYTTGEVLKDIPTELAPEVRMMNANTNLAVQKLKELVSESESASYIDNPRVEIAWNDSKNAFAPYWVVEWTNANQTAVNFAKISPQGALLESGVSGVSGADGRGVVYPKGPKLTQLSAEPLFGLTGDGTLNSLKLSITSALNISATAHDLFFDFQADEKKFEQVQVYYFVDKALRWFKENLGAELDKRLLVRVQVGDNGVSSAAFYHNNNIFLGVGDGVTYKDMLKDPSIVMHETVHAVVDAYAGMASDGESGAFNEGFADLFACLMLDNPNIGEVSYLGGPYRRTLNNNWKAYVDFSSGAVYRNGDIVAATFWDMKEVLGTEKVSKLAFKTMLRLGKNAGFNDFVPAVLSAGAEVLSPEEIKLVTEKLSERGWRMMQ